MKSVKMMDALIPQLYLVLAMTSRLRFFQLHLFSPFFSNGDLSFEMLFCVWRSSPITHQWHLDWFLKCACSYNHLKRKRRKSTFETLYCLCRKSSPYNRRTVLNSISGSEQMDMKLCFLTISKILLFTCWLLLSKKYPSSITPIGQIVDNI